MDSNTFLDYNFKSCLSIMDTGISYRTGDHFLAGTLSVKEQEASTLVNSTTNWPSLSAPMDCTTPDNSSHEILVSLKSDDTDDEWESLSSDGGAATSQESTIPMEFCPVFHKCISTPEFSRLRNDDDSYIIDCTSSIDAQSIAGSTAFDDAVLLTRKASTASGIKKVLSFKDIIMLNAQAREEEESRKKEMLKQNEATRRQQAAQRRKNSKPKLVISPIKRCAKSTGDLRSMIIVEEEEYGGGGGGGCTIYEDDVLGETDASEFYNRKHKGSSSRQNGKKLRPDEAKRKDFIIHKKNAQRKAQGASR
uniref:Uncharacterized protein n=1 Tax=Chaetoceros debilis TaxID=122233 RepID=A0A7S3V6D0_9STRA